MLYIYYKFTWFNSLLSFSSYNALLMTETVADCGNGFSFRNILSCAKLSFAKKNSSTAALRWPGLQSRCFCRIVTLEDRSLCCIGGFIKPKMSAILVIPTAAENCSTCWEEAYRSYHNFVHSSPNNPSSARGFINTKLSTSFSNILVKNLALTAPNSAPTSMKGLGWSELNANNRWKSSTILSLVDNLPLFACCGSDQLTKGLSLNPKPALS